MTHQLHWVHRKTHEISYHRCSSLLLQPPRVYRNRLLCRKQHGYYLNDFICAVAPNQIVIMIINIYTTESTSSPCVTFIAEQINRTLFRLYDKYYKRRSCCTDTRCHRRALKDKSLKDCINW